MPNYEVLGQTPDIFRPPSYLNRPSEANNQNHLTSLLGDQARFAVDRASYAVAYYLHQFQDNLSDQVLEYFPSDLINTLPDLLSELDHAVGRLNYLPNHAKGRINKQTWVIPRGKSSTHKRAMKATSLSPPRLNFILVEPTEAHPVPVQPATVMTVDFTCTSWANYFGSRERPLHGTFVHELFYEVLPHRTHSPRLIAEPNYNLSISWSEEAKAMLKQTRQNDREDQRLAHILEVIAHLAAYPGGRVNPK